ncbi:hypothetical protein Kisp02_35990 [Kineosporia sp. NBRC 101731]|nr:hypothetical protein Kisp02_35990 [Kineosporia sp. NBRC 101731]
MLVAMAFSSLVCGAAWLHGQTVPQITQKPPPLLWRKLSIPRWAGIGARPATRWLSIVVSSLDLVN